MRSTHSPQSASSPAIALFSFFLLALSPLLALLVGSIAATRIKNSGGRLYGTSFALVGMLTIPAAIVWGLACVMWRYIYGVGLSMDRMSFWAALGEPNYARADRNSNVYLVVASVTALLIVAWIGRKLWLYFSNSRLIPKPQTQGRGPVPLWYAGLIVGAIVLTVLFLSLIKISQPSLITTGTSALPNVVIDRTLSIGDNLFYRDLRLRVTMINENDTNDTHDDSVRLTILNKAASVDRTIAESHSEFVDGYDIRILEVTPSSVAGKSTVRLQLRYQPQPVVANPGIGLQDVVPAPPHHLMHWEVINSSSDQLLCTDAHRSEWAVGALKAGAFVTEDYQTSAGLMRLRIEYKGTNTETDSYAIQINYPNSPDTAAHSMEVRFAEHIIEVYSSTAARVRLIPGPPALKP